MKPDIKEMVKTFLEQNNFDGLVSNAEDNCACELKELFICGEYWQNCRAGHKVEVDCKAEGCEEIHDFHIG